MGRLATRREAVTAGFGAMGTAALRARTVGGRDHDALDSRPERARKG
jgi:hypothetical protein